MLNKRHSFFKKFILSFIIIYGINMKNKAFPNVHEFNFTSIQGETIKLKDYYGKPILIVNTASLCGFTNQYNDLEELNKKYGKSNLIIIGVPSNDFGSQEYKSNEKVNDFCKTNFNITFLLTEITHIKGKDGHPFFKWASNQSGLLSFPKWNFYKYLINKEGEVHSWYSSVTKPKSKKITNAIDFLISSK